MSRSTISMKNHHRELNAVISKSKHQQNPCTGNQLVKRQLTLSGQGSILRSPTGESATQDSQVPILPPALPYVTSHPADQRLTQQKKGVKKNRRFGRRGLP